jgi:hypothetical protein
MKWSDIKETITAYMRCNNIPIKSPCWIEKIENNVATLWVNDGGWLKQHQIELTTQSDLDMFRD